MSKQRYVVIMQWPQALASLMNLKHCGKKKLVGNTSFVKERKKIYLPSGRSQ